MTPQEALEFVNAAKSSNYTVTGQFSGGQDQGAYRVATSDGASAVLKLSRNPLWAKQIERAKAATNRLRPLGYPVPEYLYVDANDRGTFWLETELPGLPLDTPTPAQVGELLSLIDLQKGQTISDVQGQDWGWYVSSVVFRGESGLVRVLMQFSAETSALAADIENMVMGLEGKVLTNTDLVHGDLTISQVLVQTTGISGVLDWDQAGYGDRTLDFVGLWYSLVQQYETRDLVMKHMIEVSDPAAIKIFAAYKMLAMMAWHINKVGGDVSTVVVHARTALDQLSNTPALQG